MIQAVRVGVGGPIEAHFLGARPTSVAVTVRKADGTAKVTSGVATVDAATTTLSSAAADGARTLALASATGVVSGRRYLLGAENTAEASEAVTVKSVSGTTATLWAPLVCAHASGAAFAGTRASYVMSSGEANEFWFDGFADWTAIGGTGETITEVVDCALRPVPIRLIDMTDVRRVWADAAANLPASLDIPLALLEARDEFLRRLGARNRAHAALGSDHFRRPCAMVFWLLRRYELGPNYKVLMDDMAAELKEIMSGIFSQIQIPFDNKQTGLLTDAEAGGYGTGGNAGRT